ncbi:MAG: hypothetical protein COA43_09850 [Robiginitomaculum sp.]|nr:MAG: hypothetical protein COA43_09850 [Robiginitomaculum sp.]
MVYNAAWFQSVTKTPLPKVPSFSKTLQIDSVAPESPAAELRLRAGDKLLSVNGKSALVEDIPMLLARSSSVTYRFFLPRESSFLEVVTTGLPLGLQMSPSSDGIVTQYMRKTAFENEGIFTLWEREAYEHIRKACETANKRLNKGNFVGKLMGKKKTFSFADMMLAICDIEEGQLQSGYEALATYAANHAHRETSDVRAVLSYYNGLNAKTEKRIESYQEHIKDAYLSLPESRRIRNEAVKAGVEIDRVDSRIGRTLQTSQVWNVLEGGQGTKSLQTILDTLEQGQILPLCLMTAYRGNGPYNDALLPYIALQPNLRERLHPLVVLTNVLEKRKDRPHWNSHEDLAKKVNCPFFVLHGVFDDIIECLTPQGSPEFFALDHTGKIIWAGDLSTEYGYWDMLAKTKP